MSILSTLGSALMITGTLLAVLAAWGILDFPSPLARMHAATKSASLGLGLIAVGAGLAAESWGLVGVSALVIGFLFMTAPISGHLLGRASYFAGQVDELVYDDLAGGDLSSFTFAPGATSRFSATRWASLIGIWVLLWRDLSIGTIVGGALVASVVASVGTVSNARSVNVSGLVRFLGHYAHMVVASNLRVAWEVITPNNDQIREAIVAVPLRTKSRSTALLVANAISFTPGSLTIELSSDPLVLYVHVLHFTSVEEVRRDVAILESLAMRALSDPMSIGAG